MLCRVYMGKATIFWLEPVFRKALSSLTLAGVKNKQNHLPHAGQGCVKPVKNGLAMLFQALCTLNTHKGKSAVPLYINRLPLQAKQMILIAYTGHQGCIKALVRDAQRILKTFLLHSIFFSTSYMRNF